MSDHHPLMRFNIPADFVVARAIPTGAELAYGFGEGWLTSNDCVALALAKYELSIPLCPAEEEMALLLSDDLDRVQELLLDLQRPDQPSEERARLWLFLSLAWLLEHSEEFTDPFEVIDMLYADFDYPDEIREFVSFMPNAAGGSAGRDAIRRRWKAYVERVSGEYHRRDLIVRGEPGGADC